MAAEAGFRGAPAARWRPALRFWHKWFGLLAVVWLLALAATGTPIVFYDELDRALNPDWRTVAAFREPPRVDAAIGAAAGALSFTPRFIDLPNAPTDAIMMLGSAPLAPGAEASSIQVFADPATGAVLGWRESGVLAFDRRHLMDTLYGLHVDLMLGEAMTWFLGLVALAWTLDHFVAAALAVPRLAKWREAFLIGGRGLNLRRLFDLHRAPALWAFPVTLVLAFSGLALAWHEEVRAAARLIVPVSERLHESFPAREAAEPIGVDATLRLAATRTGARADSVLLLPRQGVYGVRSFDPRDLDGMGRLWTYVGMSDGAMLGQRHDNGQGLGDAFFAWQYPLHSGKGLSLAGRWLVFGGGLATILACVSGLWLWRRRSTPRGARANRRAAPPSPFT